MLWWKPKLYGRRQRADFHPVYWVHLLPDGGITLVEELQIGKPAAAKQIVKAEPPKQIAATAQQVREDLDDSIPF